jgi:hypothetical protein
MVVSAHGVGTIVPGQAGMIQAVLFTVLAVLLCAAAVGVIIATANLYLSGAEAIEHDGLARGRQAPRWTLPDSAGVAHHSPPRAGLQLVIFADHSLKSFPSVLDGLRELRAAEPGLEIVVLLRQRSDIAEPLLRMIGLDGVLVLAGSPALYGEYNVRVGPFAIFVDSDGYARSSSLVNHDWQIAKLRQLADLPLPEPAARAGRWPRRRTAGAEA